jgi:hypothetical protein
MLIYAYGGYGQASATPLRLEISLAMGRRGINRLYFSFCARKAIHGPFMNSLSRMVTLMNTFNRESKAKSSA